ncbi:putative leucine-rich repeat-containing protein [Erysiphe neolycopersici]|uniref:Putative leucine-rich repeat-containing protein n=1 Tax=Erysiphe neolycopersici TaxID=212602 RepID=A0A420HY01_9PEZI|nr:putative leucine-rich repeat-containing protein [Erysiphe neolycopersici]
MMDTEDGQFFIKNLAQFVRTHEKALANALQMKRQQSIKISPSSSISSNKCTTPGSPTIPNLSSASYSSTSSSLAAALSLPHMTFASENIKAAKLALTQHHLFYLLSRFEELGIAVGPMNIRLENLQAETSSINYVSFLNQHQRPKSGRASDHGSIHSVSSVRSVFSGMSSLFANLSIGSSGNSARTEKQKVAIEADLKYLYASFTKIPCLRLAPDRYARLIQGYEEFPFDTAVPLLAFKNVSALEISDIDIRQFFGWDKLAEQLRSLIIKRAGVDDPEDLLINIVLDDMDKRRRRSTRLQSSPTVMGSPKRSPTVPHTEIIDSNSEPGSPNDRAHIETHTRPSRESLTQSGSISSIQSIKGRSRRFSPVRPSSSRNGPHYRKDTYNVRRSGSGSSQSSMCENWQNSRNYLCNTPSFGSLPSSKWRFLKHLSLADNGITSISASSFLPLTNTLHSLDLSSNHLVEVPECLSSLTALWALNLSNCMISSLHSLIKNPLPAITALNLRSNRLTSLAGIERLFSLERLDIRENYLKDPIELARLTGIPEIHEIWVSGNPFTKTHSNNYRVTIFNLFRKTPGYTEDIIIDTHGPGYSERRHLLERVTEKTIVPGLKLPLDYGITPIQINKSSTEHVTSKDLKSNQKDPRKPLSITNEAITGSYKRKKNSKGRVINLTTSEPSTNNFFVQSLKNPCDTPEDMTNSSSTETSSQGISNSPLVESRQTRNSQEVFKINTCFASQNQPLEIIPDPSIVNLEISKVPPILMPSENIYIKNVSNVHDDVGNGWLTALDGDNWDKSNPQHTFGTQDYGRGCITQQRPISSTSGVNNQQTLLNDGITG